MVFQKLLIRLPATTRKGLTKIGNIVAETLLQTQMFPSLAARETNVAAEESFASWNQGNVCESSQQHFCFTDANFASRTNVSQFGHPRKKCFLV